MIRTASLCGAAALLLVHIGGLQAQTAAPAQSPFDAADTNHDGFVDQDEAKQFAATKGFLVTARVERLFRTADTNRDGRVSRDEFEAFRVKHPRLG